MSDTRLSQAIEQAGGLPETGRVLVLRPTATNDLSALPRDRADLVTGFFPDHEAFRAQGWAVARAVESTHAGTYAAAILFLPRSRAQARALVAEAMASVAPGAPVWIDGQKTDGIEPMARELKGRATVDALISKAHGRAFVVHADAEAVGDWKAGHLTPAPGFTTVPGVFSADGIDAGSALLARYLPADLKGKGADLGAGWGWLAAQVLTRPGVRRLHLVEAEADALDCARLNVSDERAVLHWDDATRFSPGSALDFIVTNPPFHVSRTADPGLGAAFIDAAARLLSPPGRLYLVANRTLPYEERLHQTFRQVAIRASEGGFKVIEASHPIRRR